MTNDEVITIFLANNKASGLKKVDLGLSTIKALIIPKATLANTTNIEELNKLGVYILIGSDPEHINMKKVYIGEGKIRDRLLFHIKDNSKDFWEEVIFFITKDDYLTKSHTTYLEASLLSLVSNAKRVKIINTNMPKKDGRLSEHEETMMEKFIKQIKLLSRTLGYDIFEPFEEIDLNKNLKISPEFKYSGKGYDAKSTIDFDSGAYIIKAGSTAKKNEANTIPPKAKNYRKILLDNGVLIEKEDGVSYEFTQDYAFDSISLAAQIISANSVSGPSVWKNNNLSFNEWLEINSKNNLEQA